MKIKEIKRENLLYSIYHVAVIPNWFEKLLGEKPRVLKFKDKGSTYSFSGQTVYYRENGSQTGNGNWIARAIDQWRNKF